MRRRATVLAVALACLVVPAGLFAGGGSEQAGAAGQGQTEVSYMIRILSGEDTTWAIQEIARIKGITIKPIGIDANDREKVATMIATGDIPDVVVQQDFYQLYRDGLTRSIPKAMVEKYMPNFTRRVNKDYPTAWLTYLVPGSKDQYLAVTGISESTATNLWYVSFRQDWAEKVGYPVPNFATKKVPMDRWGRVWYVEENMTVDWFEKLLYAMRDKDPDGNGKNDTIPVGASKFFQYSWDCLLGAYGVARVDNLMEDGKLVDWRIAKGYRDFLKTVQKWYNAGLVDKEFTTLDLVPAWEKISKHLIGTCVGTMTDYADMEYALTRPPNSFATLDEVKAGAAVVVIPPLVGPTGKQGSQIYSPFAVGVYGWGVNKKVDDAKLARILDLIDWMRLGEAEQWVMGQFGKPGVHFNWQGEPWNSAGLPIDYKDVQAGYPKQGNFGSVYPAYYTVDRMVFLYPQKNYEFKNYLLRGGGTKYAIGPYRYDLFNETKLAEVNRRVGTTLGTMADEFQFKAMTGQLNIDAEWDNYVATWLKNGGQEILAEKAKAPLYSELRKGVVKY